MRGGGARARGARVLVIGGSSEIALAIVRELQLLAPRQVALVGRDRAGLDRAAAGLTASGCEPVLTFSVDARALERHETVLDETIAALGGVDLVVLAVGVLGAGGGLPDDLDAAVDVLQVNVVGAGSLLLRVARRLQAQRRGAIVVLSSVAAERPRRANTAYGASKAGLDALAQALGDELADDGVQVLVVRPGFVQTRMTAGLKPAPLATTSEVVALATVRGLEHGAHTVWAPARLRWVMLVLRLLPRPVFRRLRQ